MGWVQAGEMFAEAEERSVSEDLERHRARLEVLAEEGRVKRASEHIVDVVPVRRSWHGVMRWRYRVECTCGFGQWFDFQDEANDAREWHQ